MPAIKYIHHTPDHNDGKIILEKLGKSFESVQAEDLAAIGTLKFSLVVFEVCLATLESIHKLEALQKNSKKTQRLCVCIYIQIQTPRYKRCANRLIPPMQ